ncbi:6674_t:CDS:2 [Acaulospora morrowiae]|uniref:6674_t:CDS:1 n=1 Tax=Acaulospora morrowiae TaxID=94023 RepID=A0A9N8VU46_9GLOM|nr:6674_t:CDS:2 [Acaulospora morrowiae]
MEMFDILSILLVLLIIYISHFYYKYFTRENPLPGPTPLPLFGNPSLIWGDISVWPTKFQEKYGDFYETYLGSRRLIWLCREDLIQKVMRHDNFHDLARADNDGLKEIGVLDSGTVFNQNYQAWEYHRRFYTRTLLNKSFVIQSLESVRKNFEVMEGYWEQLGEKTVLEFPEWSKRYFTDNIFSIIAGKSVNSIDSYYDSVSTGKKADISDGILRESDVFIDAVNKFVSGLVYFLLFPKFIREFPGIRGFTHGLKEKIDWYRRSILHIIKERRKEIDETPKDQELSHDLLTMFLTINTPRDITEKIVDGLHDQPMSDKEICGNMMEAIAGGIDTASNTLCFVVHYISHYPKVRERLIDEINRVLGKDPNHKITYEEVENLEYCDAIIKECFRIFSTVPIMFKKNNNPDIIGGIKFPANTQFFINLQGIHNHKSSWTNPEEFNPERFMDKSHPDSKKPLYSFSLGKRICPGKNLAILELKTFLALLYRKYNVELIDMNVPIKYHMTSLRNCSELKMRIKKKKDW